MTAGEAPMLRGIVLRFGDIRQDPAERVAPGALTIAPNIGLDLGHLDGTAGHLGVADLAVWQDQAAVYCEAQLDPRASEWLQLEVLAGRLTGMSSRLSHCVSHIDRSSGVRIITSAVLAGVSVTDAPAYPGSVCWIAGFEHKDDPVVRAAVADWRVAAVLREQEQQLAFQPALPPRVGPVRASQARWGTGPWR